MKITTKSLPYDSTYFTMSDVTPVYDPTHDTLTIYNGQGSRRSWGRPSVTSTIVFRGTVTAIHVGFNHKHRGGQGWHYFASDGSKLTWSALSDSDRQKILDRKQRAPTWAHTPGKLRTDYQQPPTHVAYKWVKVVDDRLVSLYDNTTEYTLHKRMTQKAQPAHGGGYYAYLNKDAALVGLQTAVPQRCLHDVQQFALLRCEIGGTIIHYNTKVAATYLTPLEILEYSDTGVNR